MKRFFALLISLSLCLSLAACGGSNRESAETVVSNAIKAFQSADQESVQSYWGDVELTNSTDDATSEDDAYGQELFEKIAGGLTYHITSSKEDEETGTATVTVEFTNLDMASVMSEFLTAALSTAFEYAFLPEDQQPSEEELNQMYMDSLNSAMENNKDNTVTNTVDISLSLENDAWKINPSDDVIDAMLGGMISYSESQQELWGDTQEETSQPEGTGTDERMEGTGTIGEYTIEIKGATLAKDYEGNPAIIITYAWTNNSEETTSAMVSVSSQAFQDGVELDTAIIGDSDVYDSDASWKDVRPGSTIDIQAAYALTSETSIIEFEVSEWITFESNPPIVFMNFDPANL